MAGTGVAGIRLGYSGATLFESANSQGLFTMKSVLFASALIVSASAAPVFAQTPMPAGDFATKASVGDTFEVEESKLALKQAASPKVEAFADLMIHDHTMAETN